MGRIVATTALVAGMGILYSLNACNIADRMLYARGGISVEQGFYDRPYELRIEVERNSRGSLEGYLSSSEGKLPIIQGRTGLQVGTADYAWHNLAPEQQATYVSEGFAKLDPAKKGELVTRAWKQLDPDTRFTLVRNNLDVLLDGIISGLKAKLR